jgi:hypothetical protein
LTSSAGSGLREATSPPGERGPRWTEGGRGGLGWGGRAGTAGGGEGVQQGVGAAHNRLLCAAPAPLRHGHPLPGWSTGPQLRVTLAAIQQAGIEPLGHRRVNGLYTRLMCRGQGHPTLSLQNQLNGRQQAAGWLAASPCPRPTHQHLGRHCRIGRQLSQPLQVLCASCAVVGGSCIALQHAVCRGTWGRSLYCSSPCLVQPSTLPNPCVHSPPCCHLWLLLADQAVQDRRLTRCIPNTLLLSAPPSHNPSTHSAAPAVCRVWFVCFLDSCSMLLVVVPLAGCMSVRGLQWLDV